MEHSTEHKNDSYFESQQQLLKVSGCPTSMPQSSPRNEYSARKTAAHSVMDAALLMANISQLRMLLGGGREDIKFYLPLLCLVAFSILCQALFALLVLVIKTRQSGLKKTRSEQDGLSCINIDDNDLSSHPAPRRPPVHRTVSTSSSGLVSGQVVNIDSGDVMSYDQEDDVTAKRLQVASLVLVFTITVTNMFITGLGFESMESSV